MKDWTVSDTDFWGAIGAFSPTEIGSVCVTNQKVATAVTFAIFCTTNYTVTSPLKGAILWCTRTMHFWQQLCPRRTWTSLRSSVLVLDLWLIRSWVWISAVPLSGNNLGQVVHTHTRDSVTKQNNLVPVKRQWCPAAGKVTIGLASHCVRLQRFIHLRAHGLRKGDEHHAYTHRGLRHSYLQILRSSKSTSGCCFNVGKAHKMCRKKHN